MVKSENKNFETIDKITKYITIVISCSLGAVFLAACVFLIKMINTDNKTENPKVNDPVVQNVNLVTM